MPLNDNDVNYNSQFRGMYLWYGVNEGVLGDMGGRVIGQTECLDEDRGFCKLKPYFIAKLFSETVVKCLEVPKMAN